jgi:hypothetical protein
MIIELLTPLMLATAPVQIDLPPQIKYDHATQQSIQLSEYKNQTSYTYGTHTGVPDPYQGQKDQDTD